MGWSPAHHGGTPAQDELNADGKRPAVSGWSEAVGGLSSAWRPARALSPDCQVLSYVHRGEQSDLGSITWRAGTDPSPG